jgi:transposase
MLAPIVIGYSRSIAMANKQKQMNTVRAIIQLLSRGYSLRAIAEQLGISRDTVTKYARYCQASGKSYDELLRMDDGELGAIVYLPAATENVIDERRQYLVTQLPRYTAELKRTGVTRKLLWQEYRKGVPDGYQYSQFCFVLCDLMNTKGNPVMHIEYAPADRLMIDFAGDMLQYVNVETGEVVQCPVLVCILPFSGYSFVIAMHKATLPYLVAALNKCLEFFGGVTRSLKSDNMKQIVVRSNRYEPTFTDMIEQWALHNNIELVAARVRKPQDKAPVENEVKLAYQRIYAPLRNEQFSSLEALNEAILQQLAIHHQQPFQKQPGTRLSVFTDNEQSFLQPLPVLPFVLKHRIPAKVTNDYHVMLSEDKHRYSVPFKLIGRVVQIVYDTEIVEIYLQRQRVAVHKRSYNEGGWTTVKEHMPESHRAILEQRGWDKDEFLRKAMAIGPHVHQFVDKLLNRASNEQSYQACLGVFRLTTGYSNDWVDKACKKALESNSYSYKLVQNILENNLDKADRDDITPADFKLPEHDNLRGSEAYQ